MPRQRTTARITPRTGNRRRTARNRRRFDVRRIVWPLALLVVLSGIGAGCYAILTTPKLWVASIQVYGTKLLPASAIVADAEVAIGHNILALSKTKIANRVLEHPEVKGVRIGRRLPSTVVVRIEERRPVAAVTNGSGFWLVDEKGLPFHALGAKPASLPVLSLPSSARVATGRRITHPGLVSALTCLASSRVLCYPVTKISVDQLGNLCLNMGSDFYVKLGQPVQIPDKLATVSRLLEARPKILENGEYLDVSCIGHEAWKPKSSARGKSAQGSQI